MAKNTFLKRPVAHVHGCSFHCSVNSSFPQMFDYWKLSRLKMHIFSTFALALFIFLFVFAHSLVSNYSLNSSVACEPQSNHQELQILEARQLVESVVLVQDNIVEAHDADYKNLVLPFNLTVEERISWFKQKLPAIQMFKSTRIARQFDDRVQKFLGSRHCQIQFFMTWISPAVTFGRKEFFAMESVFKAHPNGCLIILSRTLDSAYGQRIVLKPLYDHGYRVLAVTPDLSFLFKKTPAESWFSDIKSGNKDPGEIPLAQNLSNLIRLAVLYKYGGVYLDTDFIVLKDFSRLRNAIGAQSTDTNGKWTRLNNAVLVFDKNHPLLYKFMEEFQFNFDGNRWGHNGPYLVSRVVERVAMTQEFNFTVLPPMAFYPIGWGRIDGYFSRPSDQAYTKWVEAKLLQLSGETYGIHLWNRQTSRLKIEQGSLIGRLISDHCVICSDIYSS